MSGFPLMFDTHCHLNFQAFDNNLIDTISRAKKTGVHQIMVPGTDIETSKKAVKVAERFGGVYAAVGIHPHHVYELHQKARCRFFGPSHPKETQAVVLKKAPSLLIKNEIRKIEKLLKNKKVVAIGEVGVDRYIYQKTKYPDYKIEEEFVELQKIFLKEQIKLTIEYNKSLILHNREAKKDMLEILRSVWDRKLEGRTVFHCCEPDKTLLRFAQDHKMFIGVDGDVTYDKNKQEFIKTVPLKMLVLETDSPFLMPRLLSVSRSRTKHNEPKNLVLIAEFIARLKDISIKRLIEETTNNAKTLFGLNKQKR